MLGRKKQCGLFPLLLFFSLIFQIFFLQATVLAEPSGVSAEEEVLVSVPVGYGEDEIMPCSSGNLNEKLSTGVTALAMSSSNQLMLVDDSGKKIFLFTPAGKIKKKYSYSRILPDVVDAAFHRMASTDSILLLSKKDSVLFLMNSDFERMKKIKLNNIEKCSRVTSSSSGQILVAGESGEIIIFNRKFEQVRSVTIKDSFPYIRGDSMISGKGECTENRKDIVLFDPYGFRQSSLYYSCFFTSEPPEMRVCGVDTRGNFYIYICGSGAGRIGDNGTRIIKVSPEGIALAVRHIKKKNGLKCSLRKEEYIITPAGDILTDRIVPDKNCYEVLKLKFK